MAELELKAESEHGLVLPTHIRGLNLNLDTIEQRARAGSLERLGPRLYRIPGSPRTWRQQVRAAVEAAGPGAMASHWTAAALRGLPGFDEDWDRIEVTRPRARKHPGLIGRVHESRRILPEHCRPVDGIATSSISRTLFDLCGSRDVHSFRTERAMANALNAKMVRPAELRMTLVQMARRGRRGSALFAALVEACAGGGPATESEMEQLVLAVLRNAGLPMPQTQVELGAADGWIGRVDFLYTEARLVIEADSERHHASWLDRDADRRRDAALVAAGFRVIRVSWRQLRTDPTTFTAAIRAVLATAAG